MPFFITLRVLVNQKKDTGNRVNEKKNNNLPTCGEGAFLHFVERDSTENGGINSKNTNDHANDDKNFCNLFHDNFPFIF